MVQGSDLNVGACFLWKPIHPDPFLSFDALFGPRPWLDATDGEPFTDEATKLAMTARDTLTEMRERCRSLAAVADLLRSTWVAKNLWADYELGMAMGVAGCGELSRHHLLVATASKATYDWESAFSRECVAYAELAENRNSFCEMVLERIRATRAVLKLPAIDPEALRRQLLGEP
jgi:hypothetical protein